MAVSIGATTCCLTIQQALTDVSQGNVTTLKIQNHGSLQAVTSAQNRSGFETVQTNDPDGKNRVVKVKYWSNPRAASDTTRPDICTTGPTTPEKYADVNANLTRSVKLTLSESQFRNFCDRDGIRSSRFAQEQTMAMMNQLFQGINTDTVTYMNVNAGNFYNGVAPGKTVKLVKNDESPSWGGIQQVRQDMMQAGVTALPFTIGSGYIWSVTDTLKLACCNTAGIDLSRMSGTPWIQFYDLDVDVVVDGTNNFFALAPGALQMVTKNYFVGAHDDLVNGTAEPDKVKTTTIAQVPGGGSIELDTSVYRDFCGGDGKGDSNWVLTWTANFGFFNVPSDLEPVGSPYRSVNGIFKYKASCGAASCADPAS